MITALKPRSSFLPLLTAGLALALPGQLPAQTFKLLHNFSATDNNGLNTDGANPVRGLLFSGGTLYGTAVEGGSGGRGTVFKVNSDGTGFTVMYSFTATSPPPCPCFNSDGAGPIRLVLLGTKLYGTTARGGSSGEGTLFAVDVEGPNFSTLYDFTGGSDGAAPNALAFSGSTLYGPTYAGGDSGNGTVFSFAIGGTGLSTLYSFSAGIGSPADNVTNSDGAGPNVLTVSGTTLYGMTETGGNAANGTVFALQTDGAGFTTLHTFGPLSSGTNSDGASSSALVASGPTLYGTTYYGGAGGWGTLFSVRTNGAEFATLHTFNGVDGRFPDFDGLVFAANTIYGTASAGGSTGNGTVFTLNTDGSGFKVLHNFSATHADTSGYQTNSEGAGPSGLILSGNTLYGVASRGGSSGQGTIFSIVLPPTPSQLTITPDGDGGYFINAQGSPNFRCQLQRAPALTGPWSTSASQTADTNGLIQFHDLFPPLDHAFYRTVQQ